MSTTDTKCFQNNLLCQRIVKIDEFLGKTYRKAFDLIIK